MKGPHDSRDDETLNFTDEAAPDIVPTAEDKAEQARLRLEEKQRRIDEGEEAMREYLAEAEAVRAKTARLRALRLAHEAKLAEEKRAAEAAALPAPAKRRRQTPAAQSRSRSAGSAASNPR